jgi:hypothetical protein
MMRQVPASSRDNNQPAPQQISFLEIIHTVDLTMIR